MKKEPSKGWQEFRKNLPTRTKQWVGRAAHGLKHNFIMEPKVALAALKSGLVNGNPTLALLLILSAALMETASLKGGLCVGLATTVVLLLSRVTLALLAPRVPGRARLWVSLLAVTLFATAADLILRAALPTVWAGAGLLLPLAVAGGLLLARGEAAASGQTSGYVALESLSMGLGFTLALSVLGALREVLGGGTLWGVGLFGGEAPPVPLPAHPGGGFFLLGLLALLVRWAGEKKGERGSGA